MDHATMNMAATSTVSSSMASSTGSMDMSTDDTTTMMSMVFFRSVTTPLFSLSWTPNGTGAYAGTCIFLIALSVIHRILIALRQIVLDTPAQHTHEKLSSNDELSQERVKKQIRSAWSSRPFRVASETGRALVEVVIGGVGYLLMLAVMTMNVGYFLSVLGGIFLGTFLVGRFGPLSEHH
ncbi:Ctr copper transporter family-domain-containing protein [Bisporella sp. PMI_857]|nr:Ctr copper transporter family-domain-containing protein [Bisporella sp. PMI_857]